MFATKRSRASRFPVAALAACLLLLIAGTPAASADFGFVAAWGSPGAGDGQFNAISGVATDAEGNVYAADSGNARIQKFDSSGSLITKWGSRGTADGQLGWPKDVAVDSAGNVYVAETGNSRIQRFDASGTFISGWELPGPGPGESFRPNGIAADAGGDVWVSETSYGMEPRPIDARIEKFDSSGNLLARFGRLGKGPGEFSTPSGLATDSAGNLYVADTGNHRIQKFDPGGNFIATWGSRGSAGEQLYFPVDVAVDRDGSLYVADSWNSRVQRFTGQGEPNGGFGCPGRPPPTPEGTFFGSLPSGGAPHAVAVAGDGHVYTAEFDPGERIIRPLREPSARIQKFGDPGQPFPCGSIALSARRSQPLDRLAVSPRCEVPCRVSLRGAAKVNRRRAPLEARQVNLEADEEVKLRLRPRSGRRARTLQRLLKRGKRGKASVRARSTEAGNNTGADRIRVKLKP
jgi:sugar lactone lactonase YvrE